MLRELNEEPVLISKVYKFETRPVSKLFAYSLCIAVRISVEHAFEIEVWLRFLN